MSLPLSDVTLPPLVRGLNALAVILRKGQDFASTRKLDDAVLLQARLFPDMLPLSAQVQRASDAAKGAAARLGGIDNPSFPDTEATFAEIQERIAKTLAFVQAAPSAAIDAAEDRIVEVKGRRTLTFKGKDYLLGFALPNFYFHVTTAHAILRHNGVDVGKMDYLGEVPLLSAD